MKNRYYNVLVKTTLAIIVLIVLVSLTGSAHTLVAAQTPANSQVSLTNTPAIEDFHLVSESEGWLLYNQTLYWSSTAGQSWENITPPGVQPLTITAVTFLDHQQGWMILSGQDSDGFPSYTLAHTADRGSTWQTTALALFQPNDPAAYGAKVHLQFIDPSTGWLVIKRVTSSNFDLGALFRTKDGGRTWTRLNIPTGDPVSFTSDQTGWISGGAAGNEFYQTQDGGQTWTAVKATPVNHSLSAEELSAGIVEVDMASPSTGWASSANGTCPSGSAALVACTLEAGLLKTTDGGIAWVPLGLPDILPATAAQNNPTSSASQSAGVPASLGDATIQFTGQGFDSCNLPSVSKMQTWFAQSPFRVWNLYLGGSSSAGCGTLTSAYISQLAAQGWIFIPTWVGPQASCTSYASRMSSDPTKAYNQGISEADAAITAAANLGLTDADKSGTIIYYDLEIYDTTNTTCHKAAKSFISGWSFQLHAKGNQAGLYGFAGTSAYGDFASITNPPDGAWLALWISPYQYRSDASVWIPSYISNSLWANHQRIRQYSGENSETWGGVQYTIDNNVFDGIVAFTHPAPTLTALNPPSVTAGGAAFILAVNGSGFVGSSVVNWNGNARPTAYISPTQLIAAITPADIAAAGSFPVTVTNPSPGGGTSAAVNCQVITNAATIDGSVTLQGRPTPPDPRWSVPLTVTLTVPGQSIPFYTFSPTTDNNGHFAVTGIIPGSYDIRVKNSQTLQNVKPAAALMAGDNPIDFKILLEGDADNDNSVTILDFSILANSATYNTCQGTAGYDARADFNGDGCVTILDFALLAANYGKYGDIGVDKK